MIDSMQINVQCNTLIGDVTLHSLPFFSPSSNAMVSLKCQE